VFDRTLRDFKRNGLDLPDDKYDRLKEINKGKKTKVTNNN
jgi:Zn-dependent oligopeptidase